MPEPNPEYRRQLARLIGLDQLRCLNCRYDLRGQEGEQRRCPECGRINSIEEISRRLGHHAPVSIWLETAASLVAIPTMAMMLGCGLLLIPGGPPIVFMAAWFAISGAGWVAIALLFGWVARFSMGWIVVCLLYSAQAALAFGAVLGGIIAVGLSVWIYDSRSGLGASISLCPLAGFGAAIVLLARFSGTRSPYFRGRERLRVIQAGLAGIG